MSNERIMVVEDEWVIADAIQASLEKLGYSVSSVVAYGERAVQKTEEDNPDLILMDIVLKGEMDGIEAAGQINERFNIPIIYLTAYDHKTILERAKLTGPFGYMIKPFEERELRITIEMALYKHKAEQQVRASLKEKETLLKEIHHRVKNNMQVISSLLNLQSNKIKDKELLEVFKESQNRIKTMGQIHEDLYRTNDLAKVDFVNYVSKLTSNLMKSYVSAPNNILLDINIYNIFLGIDTAIPCGLILNELFTNSLKYAFSSNYAHDVTDDDKGEIYIRFSCENNKYTLVYGDNGIGLPEDINFESTKTLGLELVNTLTQQLGGSIELDRSNGTEFRIMFEVQD